MGKFNVSVACSVRHRLQRKALQWVLLGACWLRRRSGSGATTNLQAPQKTCKLGAKGGVPLKAYVVSEREAPQLNGEKGASYGDSIDKVLLRDTATSCLL